LKTIFKNIARILLWIIGSVLVLLLLLIALIRLPSVQNYITHKATAYVSGKTHTRVEIKRLYIGFPKSVVIEGLFAEDLRHDTLISLEQLEVNVDMFALMNKKVNVSSLLLSGLTAHVVRTMPDSAFNFNFFIKAFASKTPQKTIKDTIASKWKIGVGDIKINKINATYSDAVSGNDMKVRFQKLELDVKDMDLKELGFKVGDIALSGANVSFMQSKASSPSKKNTTVTKLPLLAVNSIKLDNVKFSFGSKVNSVYFISNIKALTLKPKNIDLKGQVIEVNSLSMNESTFGVSVRKNSADTVKVIEPKTKIEVKGWQISSKSIVLDKVNVRFDISNEPEQPVGMDYSHLYFSNLKTTINNASYSVNRIAADIKQLSVKEKCGFDLKELQAKAVYDDKHSELANLSIVTAHSRISNYLMASYPSISELSERVGELGMKADLRNTSIAVNDVLLFAPILTKLNMFSRRKGETVQISGKIDGFLKNFKARDILIHLQDSTLLSANADVIGLPDGKNALYDVTIKSLVSISKDVSAFLPDSLKANVNIPARLRLTGNFKGFFTSFNSMLNLHTSSGDLIVNTKMKREGNDTSYVAVVNTIDLNLGYILKKPDILGSITQHSTITGKNFSPKKLNAHLITEISSMGLNKYNYSNINLDATADHEKYTAILKVDDQNLQLNLDSKCSTVDKNEAIYAKLDLLGAALSPLHIGNDDIRASANMLVDLKGKKVEDLNGRASLNNVLIVKNTDKYRIDSLVVISVNDRKHSAFKMKSAILNVDYNGTLTLFNLGNAFKHHINKYFNITPDKEVARKDTSDQDFKLAVSILPHPLLNEVIFPKLTRFNGAEMKGDFSNNKQQLNVVATVPTLQYGANKVNNMKVEIHSNKDAMNYSVVFDNLKSSSIEIAQTSLYGNVQKNILSFALKIKDKNKKNDNDSKLLIAGNIKQDGDKGYTLRFDNKNFILNNAKWKIPDDNFVRFGKAGFYFHEMTWSNDKQSFAAQSVPESEGAPLKIAFKQFELGSLSHIMEKDTAIVRGELNGTIELRNLDKAASFVSDLTINNLVYIQNPIGDVKIKADNLTQNTYTAQMTLSGFDNDVLVKGTYSTVNVASQLNFKANIRKLNIKSVESFAAGQIRRSKGYMTGEISVTGSSSKPQLNGDIGFKDAAFNVKYINNYIRLNDNHFKIDPKGVYFNSFTVLDSLGQKAVINGSVLTSDFSSMKYDLSIQTTNFTALNTRVNDNALYYGKVLLNSTIKITGNEKLPVIDAKVKLLGGTRITFVVPESQISVNRGDGIVLLVDTAKIASIMNRLDSNSLSTNFKGIDLSANIEVTPQTSFKVIVDKTSGDSLVVKGEGELSFSMDQSGKQSLRGTYRLNDGGYKATFREVIKREFKIKPSSTIQWNGSPTDADVDITAIYAIKTSPMDLMSAELSGSSTAEKNAYRKQLHFDVEMNMKGSLLNPKITFALDMADKEKGAFGGQVYSKISNLNNSDVGELNKQVFALLVLNKFLPSGPSLNSNDGSSGAVNTLARNSVNQALADQLNGLSGKYVKGAELNFDIQSDDEYAGTSVQQNTAVNVGLKKEFLNNRVSVQVGSSINVENNAALAGQGNSSSFSGDAVIEYKLTDDGRYKLKAFRENQYDGLIDGLLYITGLGVQYTRSYDTFRELISSPKKEEDIEIKKEKKK
jgi:translocation and assembly module TamB